MKVISWIREHGILFLIIAGILLLVMTLKTQTVLLTDEKNQEYTVELQYSVFGYCVSAHPMTDAAKPVAAEYIFVLGGIDDTVQKAASWIAKESGGGVEVFVTGYPKGKESLTEHLCQVLNDNGISAKELEQKND